jgi:two-component sensor histidine kinase
MSRSIDFCAYLEALCFNLAEVQAPADGCIDLQFKGERVMLDLDMVTALGIMTAELVTNSVEHAFPQNRGTISVALHYDAASAIATMTIDDDGVGFTPVAASKRNGIGLIYRLSEQVGGSADVRSQDGTHWTITFPVAVDQGHDNVDTNTAIGECE